MAILGHLRCFVADLILSRFMLFCVNFLGQKLRLRKFVDKYHVWSTSLLWINIILVDRHQYCDISEENDQHKYNHLDPSGWHPVNWSMATILSVIQTNDLTRCGFICFFTHRSRCRELEFVNGVFLLLSCHNLRDVIIGIDIAIPVMSLGSKLCHLIASDSSHERCHYWHQYRDITIPVMSAMIMSLWSPFLVVSPHSQW